MSPGDILLLGCPHLLLIYLNLYMFISLLYKKIFHSGVTTSTVLMCGNLSSVIRDYIEMTQFTFSKCFLHKHS